MGSSASEQDKDSRPWRGVAAGGDAVTPRDLKVQTQAQRLIIEWKDGARQDLPLALLRQQCPCAACRSTREERDQNPLHVLRADPTDLRVTHAELVGTYAIQFTWSDGHKEGIFDFRFLRGLGDKAASSGAG